eukprot:gene11305-23659_t
MPSLSSFKSLLSFIILICIHIDQLRAFPKVDLDLLSVNGSINSAYDNLNPPFLYITKGLQPYHHAKRCKCQITHNSIEDFLHGKWASYTNGHHILITSACLGSDSIGNNMAAYFEAISCSMMSGMHFIVVAKVWEPKLHHIPSTFIDALPSIIPNPSPRKDITEIKQNLKSICRCKGLCHDSPNGTWIQNIPQIKQIFTNSINSHLLTINNKITIISSTDLSNVPKGTELPLIPDVAIHYRCGDNFVGLYGFLPFAAFKDHIPSSSRTIYVLAESKHRKTSGKLDLIEKCDAIFNSLFRYLTKRFPNSTILIRRGDDLYVDMIRLTLAKTLICSVSTYCLWPAIANEGVAYFPWTPLVAGGRTDVDLGFTWLTSPPVVLGAPNRGLPTDRLIKKLVRFANKTSN